MRINKVSSDLIFEDYFQKMNAFNHKHSVIEKYASLFAQLGEGAAEYLGKFLGWSEKAVEVAAAAKGGKQVAEQAVKALGKGASVAREDLAPAAKLLIKASEDGIPETDMVRTALRNLLKNTDGVAPTEAELIAVIKPLTKSGSEEDAKIVLKAITSKPVVAETAEQAAARAAASEAAAKAAAKGIGETAAETAAKGAEEAAAGKKTLAERVKAWLFNKEPEAAAKALAKESDEVKAASVIEAKASMEPSMLKKFMTAASYAWGAINLTKIVAGLGLGLGYLVWYEWPEIKGLFSSEEVEKIKAPEIGGGSVQPDGGNNSIGSLDKALNSGDYKSVEEFLLSADSSRLNNLLTRAAKHYGKQYAIRMQPILNISGIGDFNFVYVSSPKFSNAAAVKLAREFILSNDARKLFTKYSNMDPQVTINQSFDDALNYALASGGGERRLRRDVKGLGISGRPGAGIQSKEREKMTQKERRESLRASERMVLLKKFAEFSLNNNKINNDNDKNIRFSTNKDSSIELEELSKIADDFSKTYYKDAVSDLKNKDPYLNSYFTGLNGLSEEKRKSPEGDYKSLYELHDETGDDLVHSAHPKVIKLLDAMGDGGVVENGFEQQRKSQSVALGTPTGNYLGNYDWVKKVLDKKKVKK